VIGATAPGQRGPGAAPGIAIALLVFVVAAWAILARDPSERVVAFTDDAYYYYGVAANVTAGRGFTFDGIHPTNGFQPLWLGMLLPLFAAVPGAEARLIGVLLLQAALLAAGAWLVWDLLRRRAGASAASLVVLAFFALPGSRGFWLGMESAIVLVTLAIAWRCWLRFEECGREGSSGAHERAGPAERGGAAWRFGLAAAFMSLARLEGAIGTLAVVGVAAVRARRRGEPWSLGTLMALLLPMGALVGAYILWNQWLFGTPGPVSGQVKAYWVSRLTTAQRVRGLLDLQWPGRRIATLLSGLSMPEIPALIVPLLVLLTAIALAWRRRDQVAGVVRATGIGFPLVACGAIILADHLVVGPYLGDWATVPASLLTAIVIGVLGARAPAAPLLAAGLAVAFAARIPLEIRSERRAQTRFNGQAYSIARVMRDRLPPDAVVHSPFSGVLAYYSGRRVVNLDGLVNSPEYLREVVRGGRWEALVRRERPDALVDVDCGPESPQVGLRGILDRLPRGAGCLVPDERIPSVPMGDDCRITTWKIHPEACEP